MESLSLAKLTEQDVNDKKNYKPTSKIDLGFSATTLLKQLQLSKKSKLSVHIQLCLIRCVYDQACVKEYMYTRPNVYIYIINNTHIA